MDAFEVVLNGPIPELALLDATWQGLPEWNDAATWVTLHAPDMAYDGPPYPGLLVRTGVPAEGQLHVYCVDALPDRPLERVFVTELVVGGHGFVVVAESSERRLALANGTYHVEVWVEVMGPGRAGAVAFLFGSRQPRRLGTPRNHG